MSGETTIVGRAVRVERLKTVTFVWCWRPPDLIQCVLPAGLEPRPAVGSFVAISGSLRPYGGHRPDCHPFELAGQHVEVLAPPGEQRPGQGLDGLDRSRAVFARCLAIAAAQELLAGEGLVRVDLPVIVGPEALGGGTTPFRLLHGDQHALLTVNSLAGHHEYLAVGCRGVYQLSRLYWGHRSADRAYLTEINLIEYSMASAGRDQLMAMAERVMERIRNRLSGTFGELVQITRPLTGLPKLTFAEASAHATRAGVELATPHVLPRRAIAAIASALDAPAFWLLDPPASTTPYYVRTVAGHEPQVSQAADLYLPGIGEAASGSEWITDPSQVSPPDGVGAQWYLAAVGRGIPRGSGGLSLGLDRLLMYLLGRPGNQDNARLRAAPPTPERGTQLTEPFRGGRVACEEITKAGDRMTRVLRWLADHGFQPCMTNLLAEPWLWSLGRDQPVVDYFGHGVGLASSHHPEHHRLLTECPVSVYELGPVARGGADFVAPRWTLDVSMVQTDLAELTRLTQTLIGMLVEPDAELELDSEPLRAGQPGYFAGMMTGAGLAATQWSVDGQPVAWAGRWVQRADDLPDAFGPAACRPDLSPLAEFLAAGVPPAGGLTIDVTALPTLNWPRLPMRVTRFAP